MRKGKEFDPTSPGNYLTKTGTDQGEWRRTTQLR